MEEEDFNNNPFELDPFKHDYELTGQDKNKEELLYRILSGGMLLIEGKQGSGKTILLKHAIDNFKGKGKVIYVDGKKVNKRLNIEKLLKRGVLKKIPKGMILLLDNVQNLTKRNCERIKYYYDQDNIKSVVFTTDSYSSVNFSNSLRDRIGKRIIRIKDLSKKDAIKIIRSRTEDKEILNDGYISKLLTLSSKNPKQFLINSGKLYKHLIKNKNKKIKDIKKVIGEAKEKKEKEENICSECKGKLVLAGEDWRCPNCDTFCVTCGAIVNDKEEVCPGCGREFKE